MIDERYTLATSMDFGKEVTEILKIDHLRVTSVKINILPASFITADISIEIPTGEFEVFTSLLKKYQLAEIAGNSET